MKLYFSGWNVGNDREVIKKLLDSNVYKLCSFAYPDHAYVYLDMADELGISVDVMIDSGAFTAWTSDSPIILSELIEYSKGIIAKYGDRHSFEFIALDVIPGTKTRKATESEIIKGVEESKDNYHIYQQELGSGYEVMPVYHSSEPVSLRDYYLKHTDYICFSMDQKMGEKDRVAWANRNQLEDIRIHGLAATGVQMIKYIEWFSVDSAYWIMSAAMGSIFWPCSDGRIASLAMSTRSPLRKVKNSHISNLTMKDKVTEVIQNKGYTIIELGEDPCARMRWNIDVWCEQQWVKEKVKQEVLFDD